MEYVAGGSLRSLVGTLELPQILGVLEGDARRARARGAPRHRPPRPQARERARHAPRQRQDRRLRDRARLQRAEPAADPHRQGDGHAGLHVARAGARRADRPAHRPLRARRDRLRAARGPAAVRRRHARWASSYRHVHKPPPPLPARAACRPPCASGCTGCSPRRRPTGRGPPPRRGTRSRRSRSRSSGPTGAAPRRSRSPARSPTSAGRRRAHDHATSRSPRPRRRSGRRRRPSPSPDAVPRHSRRRIGAARRRRRRGRRDRGRRRCVPARRAGTKPAPAAAAPRGVVPYDFDGDGRQQLVIAMLTRHPGAHAHGSGVVLVHRPRTCTPRGGSSRSRRPACRVARTAATISARGSRAATSTATAGPTSPSGRPGRAASRSSTAARAASSAGARSSSRPRAASPGRRRALRLPAPRARPGRRRLRRPDRRRARGALGRAGYRHDPHAAGRRRRPARDAGADDPARRPAGLPASARGCALGDVDGDHRVDMVEGGPTALTAAGHTSYCPGRRAGRRAAACSARRAAPRASPSPTSTATVRRHRPGRLRALAGHARLPDGAGRCGCGWAAGAGRARRRSGSRRTRLRSRARTSPATSSAPSSRPATSTPTASPTWSSGRRARTRAQGASRSSAVAARLRDPRQQLLRPGRADGPRQGGAGRRVRVHADDPEPHRRPPARRRRRSAGRAHRG